MAEKRKKRVSFAKPPVDDDEPDLPELELTDPDPEPLLQKDPALIHPDLKRPGWALPPRRALPPKPIVDYSSLPAKKMLSAPLEKDHRDPMIAAAAKYYWRHIERGRVAFPAQLIQTPSFLFFARGECKAVEEIYLTGLTEIIRLQTYGDSKEKELADSLYEVYTYQIYADRRWTYFHGPQYVQWLRDILLAAHMVASIVDPFWSNLPRGAPQMANGHQGAAEEAVRQLEMEIVNWEAFDDNAANPKTDSEHEDLAEARPSDKRAISTRDVLN